MIQRAKEKTVNRPVPKSQSGNSRFKWISQLKMKILVQVRCLAPVIRTLWDSDGQIACGWEFDTSLANMVKPRQY